MVRQVAFLMHASKGALTHDAILKLTWRQFGVYIDSFTWLLQEQSEDGRKKNKKNDLIALTNEPSAKVRKKKMVDDVKAKLDSFNKRWEGKKGQTVRNRRL